jgi:hypothetical protein
MIVPRRMLFLFLVTAAFLLPLPAFAQAYVSPTELYWPPGEPSCGTLWYDYAPGEVWLDVPGLGWQSWYVDNYETPFCVDGWPEGTYTLNPGYAQFTVHANPPPPPPPVILASDFGCDNWDCVWGQGYRFYPDSRVLVRTADWSHTQMFYGPAWGMSPPLNVSSEGGYDYLSFQITDPDLLYAFGQIGNYGGTGVYYQVLNNDGTASAWWHVQAPRPTISSAGPTCADLYCLQFSGSFPLSGRIDFRIHGQSEVINDYTDLVVTPTLITLRLNPGLRYAYDTAGLDAWAVNPVLPNWSPGPYYLAPVDRSVIGYIDDVFPVGQQYYIRGWACAKTQPTSIDVHVYAGNAYAGGTLVFGGTANQASEPEVAAACNSGGSNYRFYLPIPHTVTQNYGGQPIYVYGISPLGYANNALNNSGVFTIPAIDRSVIGWVSGISQQGSNYYLYGWACAKTYPGSIDAHVYAGGPAGGGGTMVFSGTANQASEPAVAEACNSTGSNYRYSIQIPQSVLDQYGGQPLYVHGISPFGLPNLLLNGSGAYTIPTVDRSITGWISGISQQGTSLYLYGWACAKTYPGSIDVYVYAGGPSGSGTLVFSGPANQASEPAIAEACNSTGSNYRFWLQIPQTVMAQYGGQQIYVHGISPFGLPNLLIGNSGNFTMPGAPVIGLKEYIYLGDRVVAVETSSQ